ncbi:MAG TPA: selenium-binding family protein [Candidatus Angelobacter sp.]|nr:selenium-binding family protein [Candidatus Angelobacter sp.]
MTFRPDPTFYPSARMAMQAPAERHAYVAALNGDRQKPDEIKVVDLDPASKTYSQIVGGVAMGKAGDELHHFGWNACSSALCPYAPHPHVERRYLIVPGLRSSSIHIIDTKPDPRNPRIIKVIEADEIAKKTGYSRMHTVHCAPDGIYVNAIGSASGDGPGGIMILDHDTFEPIGRWEVDRGPQYLAYDFWWHLGHDTMLTSEWGTPNMVESGLNPELLLGAKYGHRLHVWDLRKRRHKQVLDLGEEHQLPLELRPAHDPSKAYGFVGVVISLKDLSSSIWLWEAVNGGWTIKKVIDIPAEPADPDLLPPMLKAFKAVPPLLTDIDLSLDDKYLYAACWGTGELRQYDVSDPHAPKLIGSIHMGGIARRTGHPKNSGQRLNGAPQMVEISRDGRRVYFTNSLYRTWDDQFYPDGIKGWMAKADISPRGEMKLDPNFLTDFGDMRSHQVRLEGGDASSDSYCFS